MKLTDTVEKKILEYLEKWRIRGCKILIGCSGGPDSTALLDILNKYKEKRNYILSCAYLDHGLRIKEETDKDISYLKKLCNNYKIKFHTENIEYGYLQESAVTYKKSIEEIAREKRYEFLIKIKKNENADYIALGHNYDDNIETVLMRFFQGVNFTGLCGIPEKRDFILRPIINCTKEQILAYLDERNIKCRIDKTNFQNNYMRNKLRNQLIPEIIKIYPGFKQSVFSISNKMKMLSDYFNNSIDLLEDWQEICKESGVEYKIKKEIFNSKPEIIKIQSIYDLYNKITNYPENHKYYQLPYKFLSPLKITDKFMGNRIILRGYGIILYIKSGWLFFKRDVVVNNKNGYLIVVNGNDCGIIRGINLQYKAEFKVKKETDMLSLDISGVKMPIIIRSKKPGDYILTKNGKKSIKKLFNEWKVPGQDRWKIPVIQDKDGIAGILGRPMGFSNKYAYKFSFNNTKVNKNNNKIKYFNIIINKNMENIQSE